ncbi:MAG: rhodanese-like domain-containing protein [Lachnospiraceae bacterium]|nr:rhodanese-like domain-containing protein [Lachnospiraceae bacterium]
MKQNEEQLVSIEQFVYEITKSCNAHTDEAFEHGYTIGWLEEQDVKERKLPIDRKTAARILHQYIRLELNEADETDVSVASRLQDLYECRVCTGHVMQIYAKGIMDGYSDKDGRWIFGMNERLSLNEVKEIAGRVHTVGNRKPKESISVSTMTESAESITMEQALEYLDADKNTLLIDVRPVHEYSENHLEGAVNIPLANIIKNPHSVSERRNIRILVYCDDGYQSRIAANCLSEMVGYKDVFYFASKK